MRAGDATERGGRFTVAVPGGSVARAFLPALGRAPVPWEIVDVFLADERVVPESDPESNAGLARLLLGDTPAANVRLHTYDFEAASYDGEGAARYYAVELEAAAGSPPVLDVVLLGVGDDGHVASVFPGQSDEQGFAVRSVRDAPKPPSERVTLTLQTICRARLVVVAAFGDGKAEVVRDAVAGERKELPVVQLLNKSADAWLLLDEAAASLIPAGR